MESQPTRDCLSLLWFVLAGAVVLAAPGCRGAVSRLPEGIERHEAPPPSRAGGSYGDGADRGESGPGRSVQSGDTLQITMRAVPPEALGEAMPGQAGQPAPSKTPRQAEPLPKGAAQALLSRLGPKPPGPLAADSLFLPAQAPRPSRAGALIVDTLLALQSQADTLSLPRPSDPAASEPAPLSVLRYAPQGPVPSPGALMVTFSHPMVALSADAAPAAGDVPVRIEPEPEGAWLWVGTRTLAFAPVGRFPMATEYRVTVPASMRAIGGEELPRDLTWTFTTPPPAVVAHWPGEGPQRPDVPVLVAFNQRVRPHDVLSRAKLLARGQSVELEIVDLERAAVLLSEEDAKRVERWMVPHFEGRLVALRAKKTLPTESLIEFVLAEGMPSAEGPARSEAAERFEFPTFGRLEVTEHGCKGGECRPSAKLPIHFNNPLDAERLDPRDWVQVDPAVEDFQVRVHRDRLYIEGRTQPNVTYRVTLSGEIRDIFGQTLGEDIQVEIDVGDDRPHIRWNAHPYNVLDPGAPAAVSVQVGGHAAIKVICRAVEPGDYEAYWPIFRRDDPPGKVVLEETYRVPWFGRGSDALLVDLEPAFAQSDGNLIVSVGPSGGEMERQWVRHAWFQRTDIGLTAHGDGDTVLVWVTDLLSGTPIEGASVSFTGEAESALSDSAGLARLPVASGAWGVIARKGDRCAMLRHRGEWRRPRLEGTLLWYVIDDRGLYRPGEQVHMKGWLRMRPSGPGGDVTPVGDWVSSVSYRVLQPDDTEIVSGEAAVDAYGGFSITADLPAGIQLGPTSVEFDARRGDHLRRERHRHLFRVDEFRRPEYELHVERTDEAILQGSATRVDAWASYYTGGGLAGASQTWHAFVTPGSFSPPGQAGFAFGGYRSTQGGAGQVRFSLGPTGLRASLIAAADAEGRGAVAIEVGTGPPAPMRVRVQAIVQDLNRQTLRAQTSFLVHPADLYVGLRRQSRLLAWGDSLRVAARVCGIDGQTIAGREIRLTAEHLVTRKVAGEWVPVADELREAVIVSADSVVHWSFLPELSGRWRLRAYVRDGEGRENCTEVMLWVFGGPRRHRHARGEEDRVELVPSHESYAPGDTAHVWMRVPFAPSEVLVTLRRQGILETRRLSLPSPEATLDVVIEEAHVPGLYVHVDALGSGPRERSAESVYAGKDLPLKPLEAQGQVRLTVNKDLRTLRVEVAPARQTWAPGDSGTARVRVWDPRGAPLANAQVLLFATDEAVLALGRYRLADPLAAFYAQVSSGVRDVRLRSSLLTWPADALDRARYELRGSIYRDGQLFVRGGRAGEMAFLSGGHPSLSLATEDVRAIRLPEFSPLDPAGGAGPEVAIRADFDPLAFFATSLVTGPDGTAETRFRLPDNLTRYRVMAVATDGAQRFGSAESTFTARKLLMVRPSAPRFLHAGDACELPVQVQNLGDAPVTAHVAARAQHLVLEAPTGYRVTIPARDRVEVRFPARAEEIGEAVLDVLVVGGAESDAARVRIPVRAPVSTEAFAAYGGIDDDRPIFYQAGVPVGAYTTYGGVELTTSSTALQALTDAVLYLNTYRFQCSEQLASRILAVTSLRGVLTAFAAEGLPAPAELARAIQRDIDELASRERKGAFGLWGLGQESHEWPFVSAYAAHALLTADSSGFRVESHVIRSATRYLKRLERDFPPEYSLKMRLSIQAYALYVRLMAGDRDSRAAEYLIEEAGGIEEMPLEALGWLLPVLQSGWAATDELAGQIRRYLRNRTTESAATAQFVTHYEEGEHLIFHGKRRTDAVLLMGLMATDPGNDLIVKLARGLLDHRKRGHWSTTQENAWVLLALGDYFRRYESQEPDFMARAWLGERQVAETAFRGRETERRHLVVPMAVLAAEVAGGQVSEEEPARGAPGSTGSAEEPPDGAGGLTELALQKAGAGRLYYRVGMRYALRDVTPEAVERGFIVERTYRGLDDPDDVWQDDAGVTHVRAGARVEVEVTMVAPARRHHVALVDPLPAGFEILNPSLAGYGAFPGAARGAVGLFGWWRWRGSWFEHQNLRDDRAEAFTSLLRGGVHHYIYTVRATTPGRFVAPPPRAEEMYHPETFGRGEGAVVVVE